MRVKLEQASKSPMWCRPGAEAGKAELIRKNPARERAITLTTSTDQTTGVVSTACQEGSLRQWGRPGMVAGVATGERHQQGGRTIWESERARGTEEAG
jgi:phage gpG-like protein